MSAIRAERDYVIHEDFMKVNPLFKTYSDSVEQLIVLLADQAAFSPCSLIFVDSFSATILLVIVTHVVC